MLPYWYDTTVKPAKGYRVYDPGNGLLLGPRSWLGQIRSFPKNGNRRAQHESVRGLVSQSRLLWVFSRAHRLGYSTVTHDYFNAAAQGYSYLMREMFDHEQGGFYWKADLKRGVIEPHKILYGQSIAIYALVEYHRAGNLSEPLELAHTVFDIVQQKLSDNSRGGWFEHCERDFTPLSCTGERVPGMPDIVGFRSADAHLHLMEALTELYLAGKNNSVRDALLKVIELLCTRFYPPDVAESCELRMPDWTAVDNGEAPVVSHGHMVEFAWLLLQAQRALGLPRDWDHFEKLLRHSLRYGFDHDRGGFYFRGAPNEPAGDTTKYWWVQAEGLAALTDAATHFDSSDFNRALDSLVDWILKCQIRSRDGVWIVSTDAAGRPQNVKKAGEWKAAYHEVRAITKFIGRWIPDSQYDCYQ